MQGVPRNYEKFVEDGQKAVADHLLYRQSYSDQAGLEKTARIKTWTPNPGDFTMA